jgi:hypothetical protein
LIATGGEEAVNRGEIYLSERLTLAERAAIELLLPLRKKEFLTPAGDADWRGFARRRFCFGVKKGQESACLKV